jgi:hypothetical protein
MDNSFLFFYKAILTIVFASWMILTIICQFKENKLSQWIKELDALSLIPLWTFFAPNPGTKDYHLLYREKDNKGTRSDWFEVEMNTRRRFWSFLWNPTKRKNKILSDVIQGLISTMPQAKTNPNSIMVTLSYLLVLNFVGSLDNNSSDSISRQFMLAESEGFVENGYPALILLSPEHPVKKSIN